MKRYIVLFFLSASFFCFSQEGEQSDVNDQYREDQFYFGLTYNLLKDKPTGVAQNGFSNGIHLGFIRDFPINEKRNIAFGVGVGYSGNVYNSNLILTKENNVTQYQLIDESFTKNKLALHLIEVPLQFRWRTSTATEYKFWRIYAGVRLGYVFYSKAKYKGDLGTIKLTSLDNLNKLQYSTELSFGYNTWNFYINYGLNSLFTNDAKFNSEPISMSTVKIGFMFYML